MGKGELALQGSAAELWEGQGTQVWTLTPVCTPHLLLQGALGYKSVRAAPQELASTACSKLEILWESQFIFHGHVNFSVQAIKYPCWF